LPFFCRHKRVAVDLSFSAASSGAVEAKKEKIGPRIDDLLNGYAMAIAKR